MTADNKKKEKETTLIEEKYHKMTVKYDAFDTQGLYHLSSKEKKQIENWTNLECGEVVFDSTKDNWSQNISVFNEKIQNRSNLTFIVEDEQKNKFGLILIKSI